MNRFRLLRGLVPLLVVSAVVPMAPLARADDKETWVPLFNGKNLEGWEAYDGRGKQENIAKNWVVKDGVIVGSGPASHLFAPGARTRTSSTAPRSRLPIRPIRACTSARRR